MGSLPIDVMIFVATFYARIKSGPIVYIVPDTVEITDDARAFCSAKLLV